MVFIAGFTMETGASTRVSSEASSTWWAKVLAQLCRLIDRIGAF
jgi:hypothetical protein